MKDHSALDVSAQISQFWVQKFSHAASWPAGALSVPPLQAHRGYWRGGAQENTLKAFRQAKLRGSQMIELDVQLTRDKVPVVFHDADLKRIGGQESRVRDLDFVDFQKLTGAPSLRQVLASKTVPQKINIELKSEILIDDPMERKVLEEIQRAESWDRVLISSFNPFSLWRIGLLTDRLPLALLVAEDLELRFLREMWVLPVLKFHLLHVSDAMATDRNLELWAHQGIPVAVWTVNDLSRVQELLAKGCLSVISDETFAADEALRPRL
jgi:glycerophosphoryl diester phosphodiesterase